jgi:hypothetical protein
MDRLFIVMRKLHLYASLVIAAFLLMYFLSGAVMIMGKTFPRRMTGIVSESTGLKENQTESGALEEICLHYKIHGRESRIANPDGRTIYAFSRPGYRAEIVFIRGESAIRINIREGTIWSVLNDFHRLKGYSGSWINMIWALFYDLSCIALLIFALTGVYLWWKLERRKLAGVLFMSFSTGLTVFTFWYLMAVC